MDVEVEWVTKCSDLQSVLEVNAILCTVTVRNEFGELHLEATLLQRERSHD